MSTPNNVVQADYDEYLKTMELEDSKNLRQAFAAGMTKGVTACILLEEELPGDVHRNWIGRQLILASAHEVAVGFPPMDLITTVEEYAEKHGIDELR